MSDPELLADLESRLGDVRRLRAETRRSLLTGGWSVLVLWGVVFLASIPATALSGNRSGVYWMVAVPLAVVASFVLGHRTDAVLGSDAPAWPYVVTAASMTVGGFGVSLLLTGRTMIVTWWLVLTLGFAVMSMLDRHRLVALGLVVLSGWGVAVGVGMADVEVIGVYSVLASGLGAYLCGVGLALRAMRT